MHCSMRTQRRTASRTRVPKSSLHVQLAHTSQTVHHALATQQALFPGPKPLPIHGKSRRGLQYVPPRTVPLPVWNSNSSHAGMEYSTWFV